MLPGARCFMTRKDKCTLVRALRYARAPAGSDRLEERGKGQGNIGLRYIGRWLCISLVPQA